MITISFITSRPEPRFDWFFDSLRLQVKPSDAVEVIVIDFFAQLGSEWKAEDALNREDAVMKAGYGFSVRWEPPMPTVWAGPYRLTKQNWWHAGAARCTAICYALGDYWVSVDDRCVLLPGWMDAVRDAVKGHYAVCGTYQKRTGITVDNGVIRHAGIVTGEDNRLEYVKENYSDPRHQLSNPYDAPGSWYYGCTFGLPLEWALKVNGVPSTFCDGLGGEDSMFGNILMQNRFPIRFDTRFAIVEDRTPEFLGPPMRREDKGEIGTARDKSHACLAKFLQSKTSLNSFDIRRVREAVQAGHPFPKPTDPPYDWFDKQPLSQL